MPFEVSKYKEDSDILSSEVSSMVTPSILVDKGNLSESTVNASQKIGRLEIWEQTEKFFGNIQKDLDKSVNEVERKYDFKFGETKPDQNDKSRIEWEALPDKSTKQRREAKLGQKARLNIRSIIDKENEASFTRLLD